MKTILIAASVGAIPYNRVVVAALGYRTGDVPMPLDGFGYIAPQRTRRDRASANSLCKWCSSHRSLRVPSPGMREMKAARVQMAARVSSLDSVP